MNFHRFCLQRNCEGPLVFSITKSCSGSCHRFWKFTVSVLLCMLFAHVFVFCVFLLLILLWWLYLVSCTELIKQSLVDDSKLGEAVRPYVERKMMGKHVHKYNY